MADAKCWSSDSQSRDFPSTRLSAFEYPSISSELEHLLVSLKQPTVNQKARQALHNQDSQEISITVLNFDHEIGR